MFFRVEEHTCALKMVGTRGLLYVIEHVHVAITAVHNVLSPCLIYNFVVIEKIYPHLPNFKLLEIPKGEGGASMKIEGMLFQELLRLMTIDKINSNYEE